MWTIAARPVDEPLARTVIRDFLADIVGRYHGRPATGEEVDRVLADEPADDLVPPGGTFLLAERDGVPTGCVGVRLLDAKTAEVTKLFVYPAARGDAGGARLLDAAEAAARGLGAEIIRLNTRSDLIEARRLYARRGYRETEPYKTGPYIDHCFAKTLL
ncbi:MAG TPA: GNAT family N-acetyltransferase [Amycolatopsis sp.]|nr:GNAT family N-acetyltransferase [Amycolatopsis sp.]